MTDQQTPETSGEQRSGGSAASVALALAALGLIAIVAFFGNGMKELFFSSSGSLRGGAQAKVRYDAAPAGAPMASRAFEAGAADHSTAELAGDADAGPAPSPRVKEAVSKAKREAKPEADSAAADAADEAAPEPVRQRPQSGQLTAAAWDDTLNPAWLDRFLAKFGDQGAWGRAADRLGPRTVITVTHPGGPLASAQVVIEADGRRTRLMTGTDGRAILATRWDGLPTTGDARITVTSPLLAAPFTATATLGETAWTLQTPALARQAGPRALDLALIVDATGSMSDEMRYLQAEISDIVADVRGRFPQVDMRFALTVYRDVGDAYVTRTFKFTKDLEPFRRSLAAQSAGGGGNRPEAMDRALADCATLGWRDGDVARVAFLVADAPPHDKDVEGTLETIDALRRKGVSIYPLAASDTDDKCELTMRIAGALTGGQYLFLTDDSGIGNKHAEPHIPAYHVQRLSHLMARMIASELAGKRIEADPKTILRRVGMMKDGVAPPPAGSPADATDPQQQQ